MLPAARQAYVNRVHSVTGFSHNHRLFGFRPRVAVNTFSAQIQTAAQQPFSQHVQDLQELLHDLNEQALASMQQQLRSTDQHAAHAAQQNSREIQLGDLLLELHDSAASGWRPC